MKNKTNQIALVILIMSVMIILNPTSFAFADHTGTAGKQGTGLIQGCLNDIDGSCDTLNEWKSQNISIDALFFEEQSIPIRFDVTNLDSAGYHEIVFEYDTAITSG